MHYSKPCQILVDEHDVILSVIEAVETIIRTPANTRFDADFYAKACDFFAVFADHLHHGKEEAHLFPLLEQRGIPHQGGPIGCMLCDHEKGRACIRAVRKALQAVATHDNPARETVRIDMLNFCQLLRDHIEKENQVLFVMGDQVTTDADKERLLAQFIMADRTSVPADTRNESLLLAYELRRLAGLSSSSSQ